MSPETNDEHYLTRREATILVANYETRTADRFAAHEMVHQQSEEAIRTALAAVDRERTIHAAAHVKEHDGHQREHVLDHLAIDKAEQAADKRFSAVNGSREQMNDALRLLASKDTVERLIADSATRWEALRKELDRRFDEAAKQTTERYEATRASIVAIEKGDVKQEGKGIGQAAVIAAIIAAISVAATIVSIVVVVTGAATP